MDKSGKGGKMLNNTDRDLIATAGEFAEQITEIECKLKKYHRYLYIIYDILLDKHLEDTHKVKVTKRFIENIVSKHLLQGYIENEERKRGF